MHALRNINVFIYITVILLFLNMHDKHQIEESGNEIALITTVNVAQWTNNKIVG